MWEWGPLSFEETVKQLTTKTFLAVANEVSAFPTAMSSHKKRTMQMA